MNQRIALLTPLVIAFTAAALMIGVAGCAAPSPNQRPSLNAHVEDAKLTSQIQAKIAEEPGLRDLGITVNTYKAVVHLSGFTHSDLQKTNVVRLASETDGVLRVRDDILVKG